MAECLPPTVRIVGALFHQVSVVHPSAIGTLDHGRLFFSLILLWVHHDIRLPHVIREAAMLVALHDVLYWDIPASYTSSSGYPHDYTRPGLTFCPVGDMVALLEVAEGSQGPVQVLKLLF